MPYFSPAQKFIGCRVTRVVADFNVPNNVLTTFQFDAINFDSGSFANLPNGISVPEGVSLIQYSAAVTFQINGTGVRTAQIILAPAGATQSFASVPAVAAGLTSFALSTVITRINNVAQQITVQLFQNSGAIVQAGATLIVQMFR